MSQVSKVALVTGAARGIGLAAAQRFLADGWSVTMLDMDGAELAAAARMLAKPAQVLELVCDVSNADDAAKAAEAVRARFGRLDALVNNAATAHFGPAMETPLAVWNQIIAVNLTGPFIMSQAFFPLLREVGGVIVNITSISGLRASTLRVAVDCRLKVSRVFHREVSHP
jgi:NAD(P)-dependent dehydrogenase (short-subunit alcohol dehydrogenase family)